MKRDKWIHVRVNEKEKEDWENFIENNSRFENISQLMRYLIREYIEHGDALFSKNYNEKKELEKTRKDIEKIRKEQIETMQQITNVLSKMDRGKELQVEHSIKGKILKWLERYQLTSEEIAELIGGKEPETLEILNKMIDEKLLRMKKIKEKGIIYEVINNGNPK